MYRDETFGSLVRCGARASDGVDVTELWSGRVDGYLLEAGSAGSGSSDQHKNNINTRTRPVGEGEQGVVEGKVGDEMR